MSRVPFALALLGLHKCFLVINIYFSSLITCLLVNSFMTAVLPLQSVKGKDDVEKIWRPAIFNVRQQTPLLLDSYPSPCYTTRFFEPNFNKHAVVFCKPLLLGISPKNLVLMKVKHLLYLGKLLGLRPRSEWVNTTRVPYPLGGHMKDCFIDSVKFKRLMKVRCTCTTGTLL